MVCFFLIQILGIGSSSIPRLLPNNLACMWLLLNIIKSFLPSYGALSNNFTFLWFYFPLVLWEVSEFWWRNGLFFILVPWEYYHLLKDFWLTWKISTPASSPSPLFSESFLFNRNKLMNRSVNIMISPIIVQYVSHYTRIRGKKT